MKKLMFIVMFLLMTSGFATDVELTWDFNPSTDGVKQYIIYQAKGNSPMKQFLTIPGNTNKVLIKGLTGGTYRYIITAVNDAGESAPSVELSVPVKEIQFFRLPDPPMETNLFPVPFLDELL